MKPRIKLAQNTYKDVLNAQFVTGDSEGGFPCDNEQHFDYHISTIVYHWLADDEKLTYLRAAYRCLKPGGKLVILCGESGLNDGQHLFTGYLTMDQHTSLFGELNLFSDLVIHRRLYTSSFASFGEFKSWFESAAGRNWHDLKPEFLKDVLPRYLKEQDDGSFTIQSSSFIIKAKK